MTLRCLALCSALGLLCSLSSAQTALETLRTGPAPEFRPGHTLLPLSIWGPELDLEVRR